MYVYVYCYYCDDCVDYDYYDWSRISKTKQKLIENDNSFYFILEFY